MSGDIPSTENPGMADPDTVDHEPGAAQPYYQRKQERDVTEKGDDVRSLDQAQIDTANAAVAASLESQEEVRKAHYEAIEANNQAAMNAIQALKTGEPQQDEALPDNPTLPSDLPTPVLDIPPIDNNNPTPEVQYTNPFNPS